MAAATAAFGFSAQGDEKHEAPDEELVVADSAPEFCSPEANPVGAGVLPWFLGTPRRDRSSILDADRMGGDIGGGQAVHRVGDREVIAPDRSDSNPTLTPVSAARELEKCIAVAQLEQPDTGKSFSSCKTEFRDFLSSHDESVRQSVKFRALDEIARELSLDTDDRIHLEKSLRVIPDDSLSLGTSRSSSDDHRQGSATITDRSQRTEGLVALDWNDATMLREVTADGKQVIEEWSSAPMSVSRPDGAHYFEARYCAVLPFSGESCWTVDSRVVILASSEEETRYPEPLQAQLQYEYQIREGDFNGDGKTEFYVERLSSGPADGSMQSYVIWEDSSANASTSALDPAYVEAAASTQISGLTLNKTDINADGYADHVIDGLLGLSYIPGYDEPVVHSVVVYAPGVASDKTVPQGTRTMDQEFHNFLIDLAKGMADPKYFEDLVRLMMTPTPVWSWDWECGIQYRWKWFGEVRIGTYCRPYWKVIGYRTITRDFRFALLAMTMIFATAENGIELNDLWTLSNLLSDMLGVQSFGFNDGALYIGPNFYD